MRRALVLAAVTALAVARPEMYKEKEDFQYSRSSSDDGTKSGFYGAQRGNMGGNYERAHNMDLLAQHQMGGLVRTVEGELGDGAKQRSGSVFSAANSRGIYGSGHYDLSNLEGRNFQEGTSIGESQSHSSLSSSHNAGYGSLSQKYASGANSGYDSRSRHQGYHRTGSSDQAHYAQNTQSADSLQSASEYDATQEAHRAGYNSQSAYYGSGYDQAAANSNAYGSNYRLVSGSPVRVVVRPGGRVAIPLAAQQTYDASQSSASNFDQNAINSETEVSGSSDHQNTYKPTNSAKHYESSYRYRKEWEKHDTQPIAGAPIPIPTVNPYPSNSEFNEDVQAQGSENKHEASIHEAQNVHSSNQYRGYNVKSAVSSSQLRQQAAYNAQTHSAASDSASASNMAGSSAYTHGTYNHGDASANLHAANLNNQVEDFGSKPKSYQSSYSYHKSWERQGDPYVIQPSTNGLYTSADTQASQRLTASSLNQGASGYGSHQYGAHYHQGHQGYSSNGVDCDENGHIRVARSYHIGRDQVQESQHLEDFGQQSQNLEDFSQQSQNLDQQSQNLEDFSQQSQNFDQQSQNLEDFGQHQQSQNIQELGQQAQNLEDFGQQSQNLEDLGHQPQNLEDFSQQSQQSQNLEDFGQHQQSQNLQELGQQAQNLEDFGQQSQNTQELGQQSQNLDDFGQQSQNLEDFGQQTQDAGQLVQNKWDELNQGQQVLNQFDRTENLEQQSQNQWGQQSQTDVGQETQDRWSTLEITQNHNGSKDTEHKLDGIEHTGYNHNADTAYQKHESNFEINHPAFPQVESHTIQEVTSKLNPLEDTIFNINSQNQENTQLNKEYIQHHFSQSESTDASTSQHSQSFSSMNQGNQNIVHPNWPQYLNAHHINLNRENGYNQNNYYSGNTGFSGYNSNPWMFEQTYINNPNNNFQPTDYSNVYTNTQTHLSHNDHSTYSTSNFHLNSSESGSTGLNSLWNLIDNIEKQTTSTNGIETLNSTQKNIESNSSSDLMQNFNKYSLNTQDKTPSVFISSTTLSKIETTTVKSNNFHLHNVERGDIEPEKQRPQEETGRGDIGPEDSSNDNLNASNKSSEIFEIKPKNATHYETLEEIESLSLTKDSNKTGLINVQRTEIDNLNNDQSDYERFRSDLNVLRLGVKPPQHNEQNNWKLQSDNQRTTSTTPKTSYHFVHPNFNVGSIVEKHNTDQHFENLGQQEQRSIDLEQHNTDQHFENLGQQEQDPIDLQQHNTDQQFENLGQQEQGPIDLDQHNTDQHFENLGRQEQGPIDLEQHNTDQHFENLGQQEQGSIDLEQHNTDQQFDNLGQQDSHEIVDFGQQSEHLGQQFENLHQHNIDHHGSTKEHGPDETQQQNMYHQFETPGQQIENLNHESFNQFEDFQQSEDLGKEHQQVDKQENIQDFGQHEHFQQESLSQFEKPQENLVHPQKEQQLENWSQQNENLQQQSQSEDLWKLKENLQHQSQQSEPLVPLSSYHKEGRESHVNHTSELVVEPEIVTKKTTNIEIPPETVTEKVGFWNKIGSKFVSAKDKVKNWFSSS